MIYNCKSKTFKKFLRQLTPDELVQAASAHECKHWHPKLSDEKMAKLVAKEETRRAKVEKEQWGSWSEDKPQLYMDTYDLHQRRMLETANALGRPISLPSDEGAPEYEPDPSVVGGGFWQLSREDRKKAILKGKKAIYEDLKSRLLRDPSTSPIGPEPRGASSSASSYQWLPDPQSSTLHAAGAPTGTPFLGAAAEMEASVNLAGWNVNEMPGETIDQKWFHFIYRKPLRGYENDPFFTKKAAASKDGGNPEDPM